MSLKKDLLKKQMEDVEHDLVQKHAYVTVRWAFEKFGPEDYVGQAVGRMQSKFPKMNAVDVEESIFAMNHNMTAGG